MTRQIARASLQKSFTIQQLILKPPWLILHMRIITTADGIPTFYTAIVTPQGPAQTPTAVRLTHTPSYLGPRTKKSLWHPFVRLRKAAGQPWTWA